METTVAPVPDWIRFTIAPALALLGHAAWGVAAATWALALSGLLPPTARFPC